MVIFCFVVEQKLVLSFFPTIQGKRQNMTLIRHKADMHMGLQFLTKDPFSLLEVKDLLKKFHPKFSILDVSFMTCDLIDHGSQPVRL